jgi:FtsP/CotA-like multicopper oxidase with cupredoxin domain
MHPIKLLILALVATGLFTSAAKAELRKFEMTIDEVDLQVTPTFTTKVWAYNGQVPGPLLRVNEGDEVEITVTNMTTLNHTIHWHGMYQTGSWRSDGVPDVTQKAIEPGDSYVYRFIADKPGTLWYHCHVNVPEHVGTRGMWGPFIIDPKDPLPIEETVTKDAILMFSGWNPDVADEYGKGGHPNENISFFSINGKAFPTTQPLRVKEGDVLRLRLIAATLDVAFHPHGHDMLVTHKDGLPLPEPFWADVLALSPGERYDVILEMNNPGRWIAHDHIEHHTSNNGKTPGGSVFIIEYEEVGNEDDWYVWKDKSYDPDFYFTETLTKGPGLFDTPSHKGTFPDDGF